MASKDNAHQHGYPESGFSSFTLGTNGKMTIRFHNEKGRELFVTSVQSERARKYLLRLNSAEDAESEDHLVQLLLLGLGSCLFSFALTMLWRHCRASKNELKEDLMMDT